MEINRLHYDFMKDLIDTYQKKLDDQKEIVKGHEDREDWTGFMAERNMESYLRGYLQALRICMDSLKLWRIPNERE